MLQVDLKHSHTLLGTLKEIEHSCVTDYRSGSAWVWCEDYLSREVQKAANAHKPISKITRNEGWSTMHLPRMFSHLGHKCGFPFAKQSAEVLHLPLSLETAALQRAQKSCGFLAVHYVTWNYVVAGTGVREAAEETFKTQKLAFQ